MTIDKTEFDSFMNQLHGNLQETISKDYFIDRTEVVRFHSMARDLRTRAIYEPIVILNKASKNVYYLTIVDDEMVIFKANNDKRFFEVVDSESFIQLSKEQTFMMIVRMIIQKAI